MKEGTYPFGTYSNTAGWEKGGGGEGVEEQSISVHRLFGLISYKRVEALSCGGEPVRR